MKKINYIMLFCLLVIGFGSFASSNVVWAEDGAGGQVTRKGTISFNEDPPEPVVEKPPGQLPSTGELIQKYGWIVGCVLFIFLILLFLRKSGKEKNT